MKPQNNEQIAQCLKSAGFKQTGINEFHNSRVLLHLIGPGICCLIREKPADQDSYLDIPKLKYVNWDKLKMILKAVYAI